jgi:hypothetical protein
MARKAIRHYAVYKGERFPGVRTSLKTHGMGKTQYMSARRSTGGIYKSFRDSVRLGFVKRRTDGDNLMRKYRGSPSGWFRKRDEAPRTRMARRSRHINQAVARRG